MLSKKNYPPGTTWCNSRKEKLLNMESNFMRSKGKIYLWCFGKPIYNNLFEKAETAKGITGEILLQLLETFR